MREIAEKEKAEKKLLESEYKIRAMSQAVLDGLIMKWSIPGV